jgi:DNA-binding transcriptional regulator YhcF (GntR family)
MDFAENIPIWRQIEGMVREKILTREWSVGERVPSVRELGGQLAVNPITVMRAYEQLQQAGIIENRRGIGFFVAPEAAEAVLEAERRVLITEEMPALISRMRLLGIGARAFNEMYNNFKQEDKDENKQ